MSSIYTILCNQFFNKIGFSVTETSRYFGNLSLSFFTLNNPSQTHQKNNHIPIPKTITHLYRKNNNIPIPTQLIQLYRRRPTQQPLNQPNTPNPKPMAKPTSQISDPHHHNHTHFSNLKPNTKPMEKKKNEGSLSRKIK